MHQTNLELGDLLEEKSNKNCEFIDKELSKEKQKFINKIEDLLKKQDSVTAAEIDSAKCGRTFSDRRRELNCKIEYEDIYYEVLALLKDL